VNALNHWSKKEDETKYNIRRRKYDNPRDGGADRPNSGGEKYKRGGDKKKNRRKKKKEEEKRERYTMSFQKAVIRADVK